MRNLACTIPHTARLLTGDTLVDMRLGKKTLIRDNMPDLKNGQFNETRSLGVFARLLETVTGLFCQQLSYTETKRLVRYDGVSVTAADTGNNIGSELIEALKLMKHREWFGDVESRVDMINSIPVLFNPNNSDSRKLKPTITIAYNLRDENAPMVAAAIACMFTRDPALSTQDVPYATGVPRFDKTWLLCDTIHSNTQPAGSLLLIQLMLHAMRNKMRGVVAIAVSTRGLHLFEKMGFNLRKFKKGILKVTLCWAECGSLSVDDMTRRMRVPRKMLSTNCFRMGMNASTANRLISRCKT